MRISKKFANFDFPRYDIYIFSGVWCISAAKRLHPCILYLHTPMRILYDLRMYFTHRMNPAGRFFLRKFIKYWIPKDQQYMRQFDLICANSENIKKRVLKYYGKDLDRRTIVVYTGIESKKYRFKCYGDFYLSASRLDPLKRIDMIIRAFRKMNRKLLIAGSGPDEARLKLIAKNCKNIVFLGNVSEKKLLELYGTCKATVAANIDEDLGLIAIESHASGKPVIAIKEGGFLETVNKINGVFFKDEPGIQRAVEILEGTKWNPAKIRKTAKQFDIDVFSAKIRHVANEVSERCTIEQT